MKKVVMIVRSTFYSARGGDTIQVLQTAAHLTAKNIAVDIKLTDEKIEYEQYNFLHFFNITRPADILYHIKKSRKPFLVSPIFVDYSEYDKYHRKGFSGMIFHFLNADRIEYVKAISRWLLGKDKLMSRDFIWKGQQHSIKQILSKAALLLPNSNSEQNRLIKRYNCNTDHIVVPNGIDPRLFVSNKEIKKDPLLVLCVARIEGIKNQLNLIKALTDTKYNLLLIGAASVNQASYYRACRKLAGTNIRFIEYLSQEELVGYYQKATVHILPSWFETTGLSSLEAAVMSCNVVITDKGDTREYFGEDAVYCDPGSSESIYNAVEKAASLPYNEQLEKKILTHYTWEQATIRTMEAYERINNLWD